MDYPDTDKYDQHRISFETAWRQHSTRELTLFSETIERFQGLKSETQGCFGQMTLSLAKHGGIVVSSKNDPDKTVKSLIRAYRQNQQEQDFDPITHTYNEEMQEYIPDQAKTLEAFKICHSVGNEYYYYIVP